MISVDSARPEATNTCTFVRSAFRMRLMMASASMVPFSATTSPVSASTTSRAKVRRTSRSPRSIASCSSRRSIWVYEANTLTESSPCRTSRLSTSSVSSSPSRTSNSASARSRSALAFLVFGFGASSAVTSPSRVMSSAMMAPRSSRSSLRVSRFLVRSSSRSAKNRRRISRFSP